MDPEIYIDDEPRNAIRIRAGAPGMTRPLLPVVRGMHVPPTLPAYTVAPAVATGYPAPTYAPAYGAPVPVYGQAHNLGAFSALPASYGPAGAGLFRRPLSFGRGASILAQIVASLMPLPAKPAALGKAEDDLANTLLYQQALAQHAQRDERIRTIGAVLAELAELV